MGFADDFAKEADKLVRANANATLQDAAIAFGDRLVERTPEDEGKAKANWIAGKKSSRRFDPSATVESSRAANVAAIREIDFCAGEKCVWSNGAPYAWVLEKGSSDQAPQGMLAVTSAEWPSILRESEEGARGK